jgi:hypothetical protein
MVLPSFFGFVMEGSVSVHIISHPDLGGPKFFGSGIAIFLVFRGVVRIRDILAYYFLKVHLNHLKK